MFAAVTALLASALGLQSFAKIEYSDLDESSRVYYRLTEDFAEDYMAFVFGNENSKYSNSVTIIDSCEAFVRTTAYYLKGFQKSSSFESYKLNLTVNELILDENGGNINATAEVELVKNGETVGFDTINFFIRIGFVQKVVAITDIYITDNGNLDKILASENGKITTLEEFVVHVGSANDDYYNKLSEKFCINPPTADINSVFYVFVAISLLSSYSIFRKSK